MDGFADSQLGVYSSRLVMDEGRPILLVFHEGDDSWQFLSSEEEQADECVYIHLAHVLDWDPSVRALEDLPEGWKAWRESPADQWIRERRFRLTSLTSMTNTRLDCVEHHGNAAHTAVLRASLGPGLALEEVPLTGVFTLKVRELAGDARDERAGVPAYDSVQRLLKRSKGLIEVVPAEDVTLIRSPSRTE